MTTNDLPEGFADAMGRRVQQLEDEITEAVRRFETDTRGRVRHMQPDVTPGGESAVSVGVCWGDVPHERAMLALALQQLDATRSTQHMLTNIAELLTDVVKSWKH